MDLINSIINHYKTNWGDEFNFANWNKGPIDELSKGFSILEFPPSKKRRMWTYATCGMSNQNDEQPIELHIFSKVKNLVLAEILSAIAHYHTTKARLDINHTVNFGIPWQNKSLCSYGLISLPYLDGSDLENLILPFSTIKFYWLIPITKDEAVYAKQNGVFALEDKFEESIFNYLDPERRSVIK